MRGGMANEGCLGGGSAQFCMAVEETHAYYF